MFDLRLAHSLLPSPESRLPSPCTPGLPTGCTFLCNSRLLLGVGRMGSPPYVARTLALPSSGRSADVRRLPRRGDVKANIFASVSKIISKLFEGTTGRPSRECGSKYILRNVASSRVESGSSGFFLRDGKQEAASSSRLWWSSVNSSPVLRGSAKQTPNSVECAPRHRRPLSFDGKVLV
ncbi:hypothetical protein KP509_20G038200 [Ceratopteris richardii]|uniref:Uncharacterized protein n=1 Tax=Ceratopteris richardii TaxID=49495 RepID=A0A8T2SEI3_CERRI|nr:hypothetical protein KP509_20G038200 [Ceratopteris richardii]